MKIYYAHSMHLYGTPQEERDIHLLQALGFEVVNPNAEEHRLTCNNLRESCEDRETSSALIMEYFKTVVSSCAALAYRAHPDGRIPAGVGKEVLQAKVEHKPIIELPSLLNSRFMDVGETRQMLELLGER